MRYIFVFGVGERVKFTELRCIFDAAARIKKKREQRPNFAHYLQSALRLPVGYSNIYCEM